MSSLERTSYKELYSAWKEELTGLNLTPLSLNFIKSYSQSLEELKSKNSTDQFSSGIFIKRCEFLLKNLIEMRKNKIVNSFLNNNELNSSYLSKQELIFYDYIKNSEQIIQNKSITFSPQMIDYLEENTNLTMNKDLKLKEKIDSKEKITEIKSTTSSSIKVIFLKEVDQFIYKNNQKFGPFKTNDIVEIPIDLFTNILRPKNIVKEIGI